MQASQFLLSQPINFQIFKDEKVEKDILLPKVKPSVPKTIGEDKISQPPIKKRPYTEPVISRSPRKDRLEIW